MPKAAQQVRDTVKTETRSGGVLMRRVKGRTNTQTSPGREKVGLAERNEEGWCRMHICQRIRSG